MGSRRDAAILVVAVLALLALAVATRLRVSRVAGEAHPTTFSSAPGGARALHLLAGELGLRDARRMRSYADDPLSDSVGLAVILAPSRELTPREVSSVLGWVRAGGELLYAEAWGGAGLLADSLGLRLRPLAPDSLNAFEALAWSGDSAEATADSIGRDVGRIPGFRFAFAGSPAPRTAVRVRPLARADGGATIIELPLGGGHVIAWSDASPLTNHWLRDGGAGLLFAREAARALSGGRVLEFDEYHQGYREGAGPLTALLGFLRTGPGHAALQGAVALLLLLVLSARRFGAPVPELPARRRSPLEHVSALAEAYRRAGARRTARTRLAQGLYRRLGLRLPGIREPGLPAGIERWASGSELETVWNRGEDGDLVSLAAAVDEVIREVRR